MNVKKGKKIMIMLLSVVLFVNFSGVQRYADAAYPEKYAYLLNSAPDSAYALIGKKTDQHYCKFIDGRESGITDSNNILYSADTEIDGIDARYFNVNNYLCIAYDSGFYGKDDHSFLFSVVYYDYGPGQGKFYLDYYSTNGSINRVTMIKPGKVQGWFANTVCVDDIDMTKTFAEGGNIRIITSGKNAFKKVETANLSRLRLNKQSAQLSCLGSTRVDVMQQLGFLQNFEKSNMGKDCTKREAWIMLSKICGEDYKNIPDKYDDSAITQGELLKLYMDKLGVYFSTDAISAAETVQLISLSELFLSENSPASEYNLINLTYRALFFKSEGKKSLAAVLIERDFFPSSVIKEVSDQLFVSEYYSVPRKCRPEKIEDQETGRTYYYMNMFGEPALRPYLTLQSWMEDGTGFLVGTKTNGIYNLFLYNIENETVTFIDTDLETYGNDHIDACVGTDNKIYYVKRTNGHNSIWCAETENYTKTLLIDIPDMVKVGGISLTNDCNYIGFDYSEPYTADKPYPENSKLGARLNIRTGEWKIFAHKWSFSNILNHTQINPKYPNLLFFCHEIAGSTGYQGILDDRLWTVDLDSGKQQCVFIQGQDCGETILQPTHETWSNDGEKLYFVYCSGLGNGLYALDKDGRHRQFYLNPYGYSYSHCFGSGDNKYLVADGRFITVVNTQTHQAYKIARWFKNAFNDHPYHPHPHVARNFYKTNWGAVHNDVLGVMWYDFSEIDENETAVGGFKRLNDTARYVSYSDLDCKVEAVKKDGIDCMKVSGGNSLYIDVDENIVDTVDASAEIEFEYYDYGYSPVILTYTRGFKSNEDYWKIGNGQLVVERNNTKKWKKAKLYIDSGNFENIGKYSTDFKIGGLNSEVYIRDVKVRRSVK